MDLTTPTLTLTSPEPGVTVKGSIQLEATALDNVKIDRVEFFIDDATIPIVEKVAPYSAKFDTNLLADGPHTIFAVAHDSSGNKSLTAASSFKIDNSIIVAPPPPPPPPPPKPPVAGWTVFSAAAQQVFVSSSSGNDANDGLSQAHAVKTLAKGYQLLKPGRSDLLLKCGDTWIEGFPEWKKSGLSAAAPLLISSYGTGARPVVSPPVQPASAKESRKRVGNCLVTRAKVDFVAVVGLHLTALARTPGHALYQPKVMSDSAIRWQSSGQYLLVEDCLLDFHRVGFVTEAPSAGASFTDLRMRRNVVVNNYADNTSKNALDPRPDNQKDAEGHSQGLYVQNVNGFLLEENFLDANGFLKTVPGCGPTIFNHNVYQQVETSGAVVRGNVFSRGAATGIQMRGGGLCDSNFFVQNPISMTMGCVRGGHAPLAGGAQGTILNNFFLEGTDIDANNPRGGAINLGNANTAVGLSLHDNIFSHCVSPKNYHSAIEYDVTNGVNGKLSIKDNIMWKWTAHGSTNPIAVNGSFPGAVMSNNVTSGNFPKPEQLLADYDANFFQKLRLQSRVSWDPKVTAVECLRFFRAGFGK